MKPSLCTTLFFFVLFTIPAIFLLRSHFSYLDTTASAWPLDLRRTTWNSTVNMDPVEDAGEPKFWYSVWGLPPDEVSERAKKIMSGLRSEYAGPEFEPHVTILGAISLTEADALSKFRSAVDGLKAYPATVERIATGTFYYQCVFLLLKPSPEVVEPSSHCCEHFSFTKSTPYMPHMSLLYADLSEEEKKAALEKANAIDDSISGLSFPITRWVLYKTDVGDKSTKSWEKIDECNLIPS